ncbi:hypothetical protein GOBAR_AA19613 [Gossypium barbadense]|uniref:protein S-acyltransferase n=1 Tax=Gossypium barbadense TaxID=3634 RepID=A0A2P5XCI4_GOSBA|nr:hypothetical protein GOBAR_AA19613 [Gossypium barbadense]
MSSEIEVVEDVQPLKQLDGVLANGNGYYGGGNNGVVGGFVDDESLRNDVYTVAAYGDLEKLQRLVEYEGRSLSEPDGLGYYALQWAALNNRTAAAQYIIEASCFRHSSLLEVLDGVLANGNGYYGGGNNGVVGGFVDDESLRNDVYTVAAYGDLEKLQRLVEYEGRSLSEPDGLGYYALQWAALNNRTAAAQYIIEHGGDIHAADHNGQTALHWSAVRGAIQVADILLQEGARVHAADIYGYQVTHVATQYGQTAFLYHIVSKWNADPDIPDYSGRSPLHWAAYKGFADCIRLLLFLDADRGRQDKEGCTPLHWAAIKGNLEACTVLVQAGKKEDLMITDNSGLTPAQLASEKNHRQVAFFLGNARRLLEKRCDGNSRLGRLSKLSLAPVLLFIILVMLVTYTQSVITGVFLDHFLKVNCAIPSRTSNLPKLTAGFGLLAWMDVFLASAGLVMFYRCSGSLQSDGVVANGNGYYGGGNNGVVGGFVDDESLRNDVYTVAAYGDLEKLQRLVEYEGRSLSEPDGLGYYALQWAALNNRTAAAQYIIEGESSFEEIGKGWFTVVVSYYFILQKDPIDMFSNIYNDCVYDLKDPGYIKMNALDPQNMKDSVRCFNAIGLSFVQHARLSGPFVQNTAPLVTVVLNNLTITALGYQIVLARSFSNVEYWCSSYYKNRYRSTGSIFIFPWINNAFTHHIGAITFLIVDFFLFFGVAALTVVQASQIARNITTNEMANVMRYSYLRSATGRFRNPYDHGCRKNCSDFLINGYNEDVQISEEPAHFEGIGMVQMARDLNLENGDLETAANRNGHIAINATPIGMVAFSSSGIGGGPRQAAPLVELIGQSQE